MANGSDNGGQSNSPTARPFTTFNFWVEIKRNDKVLCDAAFSECDGLEMTMEPKTHREGGNNVTQYQMVGPVTYGQLTLKRGMTETFDLWDWFNDVNKPDGYSKRTEVIVEMLNSAYSQDEPGNSDINARFTLANCLPVKMRAPTLTAGEGGLAIEELQVAYERLDAEIPGAPSDKQSTKSTG